MSDTYREAKVFEYQNATVRVFSPVLTVEEQKRRMKIIHDAAAELLKLNKINDQKN